MLIYPDEGRAEHESQQNPTYDQASAMESSLRLGWVKDDPIAQVIHRRDVVAVRFVIIGLRR
jgi:hypothetical protein